jgi:hypothetical protein
MPETDSRSNRDAGPPLAEPRLSTRPVTALVVLLPVCWLLGVRDFAWVIAAVPMVAGLARLSAVRTPPGFGLWLLFLTWVLMSVIQIDNADRLLGFVYRGLLYASATVVLLYVYNVALQGTPWRRVTGAMTALWIVVVAGGFLALLFPDVTIMTPAAQFVPARFATNELIGEMIRPSLAQYSPDGFFDLSPRPSAPFAYTNNWGNAYSLLLPFVLVHAASLPARHRARPVLMAVIAVSLVPALLSLNRGMYLALAVGLAYVGVRMAIRGQVSGLVVTGSLALAAMVVVQFLPVTDLLAQRLASSATNETRLSVYQQAVDGTLKSPVFGYGAPRPAEQPSQPSVGTQGQFWTVLFSHGFPGAAMFVGWLLATCLRSARPPHNAGLWLHGTLVMATIEVFYYGILGAGLTVVMVAAALTAAQSVERSSHVRATVVAGDRSS